MITYAFILLIRAFRLRFFRHNKRSRTPYATIQPARPDRTPAQAERERQNALKRQAAIEQAQSDIGHYNDLLQTEYARLNDLQRLYDKAQKEVDRDEQANKFGAVVAFKVARKHITERDRALAKLSTCKNKIHTYNARLRKAETMLNIAGDS